jgi:hypothetical protein
VARVPRSRRLEKDGGDDDEEAELDNSTSACDSERDVQSDSEEERDEEREERRRQREEAREEATQAAMFAHYVALVRPHLAAAVERFERLRRRQPGVCESDLRSALAAAAEHVRVLRGRVEHRGGRSEAERARLHDLSDMETVDERVSQACFDAMAEAEGENVMEAWEATPAGGFRRAAFSAPRDDDYDDFMVEWETTRKLPACLASHGSEWMETRKVPPPLEGQLLVGPLPPHWATEGRDPATDPTLTCKVM